MSTAFNNTNLGNTAQANILIANTLMNSPSFSQPEQLVGTSAAPVATFTQVYTAGVNKYIFYSPLTTSVDISANYTITSMPAGFGGLYSVVSANMAVATASFSTAPIISVSHITLSDTTDALSIRPISSTSPVFASGTAYLKLVVQFTLD